MTAAEVVHLADLVRHVRRSSNENGPIVDILLERADRMLAKDGGRKCKRVLTDEEVDLLLAGDEPEGAA
ncbi:MAG TPA: hypothetical protein VKM54_04475 [Myxococcota bacterium]|nr:hypothetical protein [Myxococcota bacterium]